MHIRERGAKSCESLRAHARRQKSQSCKNDLREREREDEKEEESEVESNMDSIREQNSGIFPLLSCPSSEEIKMSEHFPVSTKPKLALLPAAQCKNRESIQRWALQ